MIKTNIRTRRGRRLGGPLKRRGMRTPTTLIRVDKPTYAALKKATKAAGMIHVAAYLRWVNFGGGVARRSLVKRQQA